VDGVDECVRCGWRCGWRRWMRVV